MIRSNQSTIAVAELPNPLANGTQGEFQFAPAASLDVGITSQTPGTPDYSRQS